MRYDFFEVENGWVHPTLQVSVDQNNLETLRLGLTRGAGFAEWPVLRTRLASLVE